MAKKNKKRLSERLHDALNNLVAKQLLADDFVHFDREGDMIISQGTREALNRSDTIKSYVKATHWFNIFWYYVSIQIRKDIDGISEIPFVSVSFFQEENGSLNQLFRAEWDNYGQKEHPQPHWHITSYKEMGFETMKDDEGLDNDSPFAVLENEERKVDLPKMHFAMAGDWHDGGKDNMVNNYTDENQLANWLNNLFDHVREEIAYAY
jgi:hypothetical protein